MYAYCTFNKTQLHGREKVKCVVFNTSCVANFPSALPHLDVFDAETSACSLNGKDYIAVCYQVTWSMSPMSSAWSTLRVVSVIVRLPHINVFDVVVVVVD